MKKTWVANDITDSEDGALFCNSEELKFPKGE